MLVKVAALLHGRAHNMGGILAMVLWDCPCCQFRKGRRQDRGGGQGRAGLSSEQSKLSMGKACGSELILESELY